MPDTHNWPPAPGTVVNANGKLYGTCTDCGRVIRLNKPLFGSMHVCVDQQELAQRRGMQKLESWVRQQQVAQQHAPGGLVDLLRSLGMPENQETTHEQSTARS